MRNVARSSPWFLLWTCSLLAVDAGCASASRVDPRFATFLGLETTGDSAPSQAAGTSTPVAVATPDAVAPPATFVVGGAHPNRYAVIIGIERYRDARSVPGAGGDAERFALLAQTTMGVPEDHIKLLLNDRATRSDIENAFAWVGMRTNNRSEVLVFFAGHGSASAGTDKKLLPLLFTYESNPSDPGTAIPLYTLLTDLGGGSRPGTVLAFVDACSETIEQTARGGLVLQPQMPDLVVYSAASIGQLSSPLADGSGGVFTTHLLTAIGGGAADANGDAEITLNELDAYVTNRVHRYSSERLNRRQTPVLAQQGRLAPDKISIADNLASSP